MCKLKSRPAFAVNGKNYNFAAMIIDRCQPGGGQGATPAVTLTDRSESIVILIFFVTYETFQNSHACAALVGHCSH